MTLRAYDSRTRRHRSALQGRLAPTKAVLARVLFMRFFCFTRSCASASTSIGFLVIVLLNPIP